MSNEYVVERARSARSNCKAKKCPTKTIEKNTLRIGKQFHSELIDHDVVQWYHPECLFESFKRAKKTTKIVESEEDLQGFNTLTGEEQDSIRKLIEQIMLEKQEKAGKKPNSKKGVKQIPTPTAKVNDKTEDNKAQECKHAESPSTIREIELSCEEAGLRLRLKEGGRVELGRVLLQQQRSFPFVSRVAVEVHLSAGLLSLHWKGKNVMLVKRKTGKYEVPARGKACPLFSGDSFSLLLLQFFFQWKTIDAKANEGTTNSSTATSSSVATFRPPVSRLGPSSAPDLVSFKKPQPKRTKIASISTSPKKKAKKSKKKNPDPNQDDPYDEDEDEDLDEPNEYDLNDPFIDDSSPVTHDEVGGEQGELDENEEELDEDEKETCKYGKKCYQKNPDHLRRFWHPS